MRRKLSNNDMHLIQGMSLKDSRKYMNEIPRHNRGLNDRSRRSRSNRHHFNIAQETLHGEYTVSQFSNDSVHDEISHEKEIIVAEELAYGAGLIVNEIQDTQLDTSAMSSIHTKEYEHSRSVCQPEIPSPQHDSSSFSTQVFYKFTVCWDHFTLFCFCLFVHNIGECCYFIYILTLALDVTELI